MSAYMQEREEPMNAFESIPVASTVRRDGRTRWRSKAFGLAAGLALACGMASAQTVSHGVTVGVTGWFNNYPAGTTTADCWPLTLANRKRAVIPPLKGWV